MDGVTQVLLRNLQFGHHGCMLHSTEQGAERLARLKIDRTVFHLHNHIVAEFSVERHKFGVGLLSPILIRRIIDKSPPHDDSPEGFEGIGHHISPIGMGPAKILRPGLTFAIGLYQKAAKIRNQAVNLLHLLGPPFYHLRIERIGRPEPPDYLGRSKIDRQVNPDPIWPKHIGNGLNSFQIGSRQHLRRSIYIIQHRPVNPDRGICPCILPPQPDIIVGYLKCIISARPKDRFPGIPPLNRTIHIIPMIQQPQIVRRLHHKLVINLHLAVHNHCHRPFAQHFRVTLQVPVTHIPGTHHPAGHPP